MFEDVLAILVLAVTRVFLGAAKPAMFDSLVSSQLSLVLKLQAGKHIFVVLLDVLDDSLDFVLDLVPPRHEIYNNKCH
mgnify:FL=1